MTITPETPRLVETDQGEIRCEACELPRLLEQPVGCPCIPCLAAGRKVAR